MRLVRHMCLSSGQMGLGRGQGADSRQGKSIKQCHCSQLCKACTEVGVRERKGPRFWLPGRIRLKHIVCCFIFTLFPTYYISTSMNQTTSSLHSKSPGSLNYKDRTKAIIVKESKNLLAEVTGKSSLRAFLV